MIIRKATMSDLDTVFDLYAQARRFMKENGNPDQWGDNYPPRGQIIEDIQKNCCHFWVFSILPWKMTRIMPKSMKAPGSMTSLTG